MKQAAINGLQNRKNTVLQILGIDVGSVAVSAALLNQDQEIIETDYRLHQGAIRDTLIDILKNLDLDRLGGIAVTASTPDIIKKTAQYDNQLAIITAVKKYHPDAGNILMVGGENFGLISFNESGEYESYKTNSTCAVGTGSFLDQQVARLNLESIEELARIAFSNKDIIPAIASRCAVFAKTDLINAQQEGYSPAQICDSLCQGLVHNISDTLFGDEPIRGPIIFTGGVSRNKAVIKHLTALLGAVPVVGKYAYLYGAIGAALMSLNEKKISPINLQSVHQSLIIEKKKKLKYAYQPLELKLSDYPDFESVEKINYVSSPKDTSPVEVDIYAPLSSRVYMGIDIGSTSTKAVLTDENKRVLAGFYTRTAGRPLKATLLIFEAIDHISTQKNIDFQFKGVATTGAGRKFVGKIIGADLMIDEITTHARAAFELDPEVDTIIEIGGQDSKFTTLKNGMVTFCVMNNVCAAGTGSFIEEQARKLGCALSEYSRRAEKKSSPVSSDRCTVSMERDINYYLGEGYEVGEILACVLHSVRDNYFSKVAGQANIGERIFFQGATAKNKALVAAFENKLKKAVHVSRYCHVTGALGSALLLAESNSCQSKFRGLSLCREEILIESETCEICPNNCRIKKVSVQNELVSFGFLCGRDPSQKSVDHKKNGYELLKAYKQTFNKPKYRSNTTIGIPCGLYLSEEKVLWAHFFNRLGIKTISSEGFKEAAKIGKKLTKTEFCTPMTAFYGQVKHLSQKADYLFLPVCLDSREKEKEVYRHYCYYTQFAASLVASSKGINLQDRALMPVIGTSALLTKVELYKALKPVLSLDYWSIASAYDEALEFYEENRSRIQKIYQRENQGDDIKVMLLGRPYIVLDNTMNKGIPGIFDQLGIKAFYHDMLAYTKDDLKEIEPLLKAFHWNCTAQNLSAALIVAKTSGIYPVYISCFKCSPDSFALEYFRRIMDKYKKPYLILDLDEHGSNVGYETRIEAAVRAFRNHHTKKPVIFKDSLSINPYTDGNIAKKTFLLPCWDHMTVKLIEAVLVKHGIDARMAPITEHAIQQSSKSNTGQCLPVTVLYQSFVDYVKENDLDPSNTSIWMINSSRACNVRMYPYMIKSLFESCGNGMGRISVYAEGDMTLLDMSAKVVIEAYLAYLFSGMLRKMGCRIRPYEKEKGSCDEVIKQSEAIFYEAFLGKKSREKALMEVVGMFKKIRIEKTDRPQIAIFGDMFVRDNDIMNQQLIKYIEKAGGEVITTPMSVFAKMVLRHYIKGWLKQGDFKEAVNSKGYMMMAASIEKKYYKHFNEILQEPPEKYTFNLKNLMESFHVTTDHSGESMDNLVMIFSLIEQYPDISLFVQTSPAFCCAGLITEAMASQIETHTKVPIVSLTYDGTGKNQNDKLIPYIKLGTPPRRL